MFSSLRKQKKTLRQVHSLYLRKAATLDENVKTTLHLQMEALRTALLEGNAVKAKTIAKNLEASAERFMPKNSMDKTRDFFSGLFFALFVAVVIRTMWFELYTIPTGSMRPTLKEDDYLIVSKTDYGINVPLAERHFYFDPTLVQRGSIVVFNSANIDIEDSDTTYFYLFPGKKQFVKRLVGKPGDTLYFYGGKLYGVDKDGKELTDLEQINQIEHIPFIRLDGKVEATALKNGVFHSATFLQMNQPIVRLDVTPLGPLTHEMLNPKVQQYADFIGMKHFAMARLLTKEQVEKIYGNQHLEEGLLYLELTHHPTTSGAHMVRDEYNRLRPEFATHISFIPLQEKHLEAISKHMTTCRFTVKDGIACRFGWSAKELGSYLPKFPNVPDGTYEIQDGKVYELPFPSIPLVGLFTNGVTKELPKTHPLYAHTPEMVQKLYNFGIEFLNHYAPVVKEQRAVPSRYAYFRNGDLYLLSGKVIAKDDATLLTFHTREEQKRLISTSQHPYLPFKDSGAPTLEEIRKNGIQVPEKMYLALGDNHAMSADSRQFGFVPEDNLKGGVSFIFAPIGDRMGHPPQPSARHLTFPNLFVLGVALCTAIGTTLYYRHRLRKPLQRH